MSDLIVISFKGQDTADQVLNKLREMQKEYLIDLEDACVVVRDQNGKVRLKQAVNLTSAGALGGALASVGGTITTPVFSARRSAS